MKAGVLSLQGAFREHREVLDALGVDAVEVGPFNDTSAELIPRTAKGSSRARAQLALDNRGNVRINARLTAADPDRKLNFTITPPALTAEPGTASFATVRVSPRQRFLTGPPKISPYKVLVHQDGLPTITVDGAMQQEGLIPAWLLPALIGLAALLLVLVILWFVLLKPSISSAAKDAVAPQASAAQSAAARAQVAANAAGQKPAGAGGGATGANPFGGDAYAARLSGIRKTVNTTVGRCIISEVLPDGLSFDLVNKTLDKKALSGLIDACYRKHRNKATVLAFAQTRCPFRKSCASALPLGAPGSSPASEATLERGAPRENPKLAMNL